MRPPPWSPLHWPGQVLRASFFRHAAHRYSFEQCDADGHMSILCDPSSHVPPASESNQLRQVSILVKEPRRYARTKKSSAFIGLQDRVFDLF